MEVKCPQCGRIFDLPETKVGRTLKCICKFSFRYDSAAKVDKNEKSPPTTIQANINLDETGPLQSNMGNMSEGEIDNFLDSLRQSKSQVKNAEDLKEVPDVPPPPDPHLQIDLDRKQEEVGGSQEQAENLIHSQTPEELVEPPSKVSEITYSVSIGERINQFVHSQSGFLSLLSAGLVSLLVLVFVVIFSSGEDQPEEDPFLSELLEGAPPPTQRPSPPKAPPQQATEKPKATEVSKRVTKKIPPASTDSPKIRVWSLNADYSKITDSLALDHSFSRLDDETYFYEAAFFSWQPSNPKRKQIQARLNSRWTSTKEPLLARALAVSMLTAKRELDAVKQFKNLSLTRSRDPFVFAFLGLAYEKIDRPKLALNSYSQALSLNPEFPWVLLHAARLSDKTRQTSLALEFADRLAKTKSPLAGEGYLLKAKIFSDQKKWQSAAAALKQSIKEKESYEARHLLGKIYLSSSDGDSELQFRRAVDLASSSKQKRNAWLGLGQSLCGKKDREAAGYAFRKAYLEDSSFIYALEEKARCESKLGAHAASASTYQLILKQKPQDAALWLAYGSSLRMAKKQKPAVAALKRSLALKDSDAAHYEIALAYLSLNRKSEAAYHAKQALRMNPRHAKARNLSASLQ